MVVRRTLGIAFTAAGLLLAVLAAVFGARTLSFVARSEAAPGVVVGLVRGGRRSVVPEVEFTPRGKAPTRMRGSVGSSPPRFRIGERVTVLYDPADPSEAELDDPWHLWFLPGLLAGISLPWNVVGPAFLVSYVLGRRREARLRAAGRRVTATVVGHVAGFGRVNRRRGRRLVAEARNEGTGALERYESHDLYEPVGPWIGQRVTIYVDPRDPREHVFDLPAG